LEIKENQQEMPTIERITKAANRGFLIGIGFAVAFILWQENARHLPGEKVFIGVGDWLATMNWDSSPFLVWFVLLPVFWLSGSKVSRFPTGWAECFQRWFGASTKSGFTVVERGAVFRLLVLMAIVGGTSLCCSGVVSRQIVDARREIRFGDLPPAYHDEFSYLLQAKTFLAGELSFPSHPTAPEVFEQMHVVNEGRYASRYFPATGAWMAPFLAMGDPYWGHWLAGAISAILIFAAGRELGGNGVGFTAGMLTAMSPGMAFFSNLLLAHHPAMLGLSLFLFAFLRLLRTRHWFMTFLASCGLTFAMLARPMTAAGFGFSFGVWFLVWLIRSRSTEVQSIRIFRVKQLLAMSVPIICGLGFLMILNNAITENPVRTPYDLFTETYTPRHGYGFNNVTRAEQRIAAGTALTKTTFDNYDRWAINLTPEIAKENVAKRWRSSWEWTLAIVPLLIAVAIFLTVRPDDYRWWLIGAAILSLHIVHIPYWYAGIQQWHYVFETGPLWILIFARSTSVLNVAWNQTGRASLMVWWGGLVVISLSTAYFSETPFWIQSRISVETEQATFSRMKYHGLRQLVEDRVTEPKALILLEHDPADRHIDYVFNEPDLQGNQRFLFGRFLPKKMKLEEIVAKFPSRACYLYRVKQRTFERVSQAIEE
jgi:hypothetical protein